MRSLAVLTEKYKKLARSQPHDMCVSSIDINRPFYVNSEMPDVNGFYEVTYHVYYSGKGMIPGWLRRHMFTYLSSKAKKRTGKRKRKLKHRKGTPRKGRK